MDLSCDARGLRSGARGNLSVQSVRQLIPGLKSPVCGRVMIAQAELQCNTMAGRLPDGTENRLFPAYQRGDDRRKAGLASIASSIAISASDG